MQLNGAGYSKIQKCIRPFCGRLEDKIKTLGGTTTYQFKQITYDTRNRVSCETQRMNPATYASPPASACALGTSGLYGSDRIRKYEYDSESRSTRVISGFGTVNEGIDRQTTYTNNGQVASLTDGNGNATTYLYDGHDRLNRVTYKNATYELFGYDNNGNKTSWRKRDGTTLTYQYEVTNQLKTTAVPGCSHGDAPLLRYGFSQIGFKRFHMS